MRPLSSPRRDLDARFRGGRAAVSNGVMKAMALPLLALLAPLAACGDYNPEDIVFRRAAPRPEDVALEPPGVDVATARRGGVGGALRQGLTACDGVAADRNLRCLAQSIAGSLNGLTVGILTVVDNVVQSPPSQRARGRRVWGPHFVENDGATYRFEMVRDDDTTFSWCIHAAAGFKGPFSGRGLSCDAERSEDGFVRVVSGTLVPGEAEDELARSGLGSIVFELTALGELARQDTSGLITILYDNTGGESDIDIALDDMRIASFPERSEYSYHRYPDGSGGFFFQAPGEASRGGLFEDELLETFTITAAWQADRAGRADAVITGGNLDTFEISATQCWDAELCQVHYTQSPDDPEHPTEGDLAACVFQERIERSRADP